MNATSPPQPTGPRLSRADLRRRWRRMIGDPLLEQIPGKLELNEKGSIEVSPASNRHAFLQAYVTGELRSLRPDGTTFTECSIETDIGVRVPDVAWASAGFIARHGMTTPLPSAPEICVEVLSPSNFPAEMAEKIRAYLAAGAREVWLVQETGELEIHNAEGRQSASWLGVEIRPPR